MILTLEILVALLVVAALVVFFLTRPDSHGPVETDFVTALTLDEDRDLTPRLELEVLENGDLLIRRCGLLGLTDSAIVALAITRVGFTLSIEERVTPGVRGQAVDRATFIIGGLAPERYNIRYNSSAYSTFLSTAITLRPGIRLTRPFPA